MKGYSRSVLEPKTAYGLHQRSDLPKFIGGVFYYLLHCLGENESYFQYPPSTRNVDHENKLH